MYKFNWDGFTQEDYKTLKENLPNIYEGYCGNVRAGTLCFDLMVREEELQYDLYVYGIDDDYDYAKDGTPYAYADGGSFQTLPETYEEFKQIAETEFTHFIEIDKWTEQAEKELVIW